MQTTVRTEAHSEQRILCTVTALLALKRGEKKHVSLVIASMWEDSV